MGDELGSSVSNTARIKVLTFVFPGVIWRAGVDSN